MFDTLPILDDFNRADGGLGANWSLMYVGDSDPQIISNTVGNTSGDFCDAYWTPRTFGPACGAYIYFSTMPETDAFVWVAARLVAPGTAGIDGYQISFQRLAGTDSVQIRRIDNGVRTTLGATINQEFATGEALGVQCLGDQISTWRFASGAWSQLGVRTDSTYAAAGNISFGFSGTSVRLDNFGGGTMTAFQQIASQRARRAFVIDAWR